VKAEASLFHPGTTGEGKTGRVNASESSYASLSAAPRVGGFSGVHGFRPGRSCHDAIQAIYTVCRGPRAKRVWALDADLAAAFDRIDHSRLLESLGSFPARDMVRDWLKAGVFEAGK
jgi:hypothetical protein